MINSTADSLSHVLGDRRICQAKATMKITAVLGLLALTQPLNALASDTRCVYDQGSAKGSFLITPEGAGPEHRKILRKCSLDGFTFVWLQDDFLRLIAISGDVDTSIPVPRGNWTRLFGGERPEEFASALHRLKTDVIHFTMARKPTESPANELDVKVVGARPRAPSAIIDAMACLDGIRERGLLPTSLTVGADVLGLQCDVPGTESLFTVVNLVSSTAGLEVVEIRQGHRAY